MEDNSDCQENSDSSTEGHSKMETVSGVSKIAESVSSPTGKMEIKNQAEKAKSPTSHLNVCLQENTNIDCTQIREESQSGYNVERGSGSLGLSLSAVRSQQEKRVRPARLPSMKESHLVSRTPI